EEGDWRARVLAVAERGLRAVERDSLAAWVADDVVVLVPSPEADVAQRVAEAASRELEMSLTGFHLTLARSRPTIDPADLHRAGAEAALAANVAHAQGTTLISFEETGAYRLLLPAMSEDPTELQRFHDETVAPLVAYDDQYETDLVHTLDSFLEADGNVARTAEKLFTHRHTVRYRLERVKELSGLDVGSTDGRERLGLGLKAMRVLGIPGRTGPAYERGAGGGRVPAEEKDR
ncbi:MAG: helix-turn-helix domain-containing protein, partial [Thermoleophilaceae bacterium]|nr:helix-turn-helix domain-containing protein [Thermoleophilaceae bacterium]